MREMTFLTAADSRRMEAAEEHGALSFARAMQAAHPDQGVSWEPIGGGHMIFVAKGAPVGRAHALGFTGKVPAEDIEKVERFYFQRGAAAEVDVSPYADPSLFELLNRRGYQVAEFNQTLARWIDPAEPLGAKVEGIEIRQVRPDEADTWSGVLSRIFFGDQAENFQEMFTPWAATENPLCLAAFVNGVMIAGAGGMIVPGHRMAAFFGAATSPEFQKRGIQTAFLQERLRIAREAGCDLAVTLTMPGTTSQHNAERAGFRVAYTKVVVAKAPPGSQG